MGRQLESTGSEKGMCYQVHSLVLLQATPLLPTDICTNTDPVTPDFVRYHIVYCTAPSTRVIPGVTLSGPRGTISKFVHEPFDVLSLTRLISSNNLTFRSTLFTDTSTFQGPIVSTSRTSTLASLPPSPTPLVAPLNPEYIPNFWGRLVGGYPSIPSSPTKYTS